MHKSIAYMIKCIISITLIKFSHNFFLKENFPLLCYQSMFNIIHFFFLIWYYISKNEILQSQHYLIFFSYYSHRIYILTFFFWSIASNFSIREMFLVLFKAKFILTLVLRISIKTFINIKSMFGYRLLLKTKNWKYCNKINFKYVNSAAEPSFEVIFA